MELTLIGDDRELIEVWNLEGYDLENTIARHTLMSEILNEVLKYQHSVSDNVPE
jgi:hypothetical protein